MEYVPQVGYLGNVYSLIDSSTVVLIQVSLLCSVIVAVSDEHVHLLNHSDSDVVDEAHFQFIFAQDNTRYFKHAVVSDMDDKIGDIKSIILDRQKMLMLQIEDSLLDAEPQLQHISIIMATLDALISLGSSEHSD